MNTEFKAWETEERAVTLTNEQWNRLACYLIMTTNYREGELSAWEILAAEKNDDGTPRFENAVSNVAYWKSLIADLEVIKKAIDGI